MSNIKIEVFCGTCGKSMYLYPSQFSGQDKVYCSNECRYESRRGGKWKPHNKIDEEQALQDLRDIYAELGRYPTAKDVNAKWPHRSILYGRRYGTVENALRVAGIEKPESIPIPTRIRKPNIKKYEIRAGQIIRIVLNKIEELIPLRNKIKRERPERKKYAPTGKSRPTYTKDQLILELKRVADLLGHTPTDTEFRQHGNCSTAPFWTKWKSWAEACRVAGLEPHTTFEGGFFQVKPYSHIRKHDNREVILTGTYELRFAKKMDSLGWVWFCQSEYPPIIYHKGSKRHRYIPDFYIPHLDVYIETKGWFREEDQVKMKLVRDQNPRIVIFIIGERGLKDFEQTGELPVFS